MSAQSVRSLSVSPKIILALPEACPWSTAGTGNRTTTYLLSKARYLQLLQNNTIIHGRSFRAHRDRSPTLPHHRPRTRPLHHRPGKASPQPTDWCSRHILHDRPGARRTASCPQEPRQQIVLFFSSFRAFRLFVVEGDLPHQHHRSRPSSKAQWFSPGPWSQLPCCRQLKLYISTAS